MMAWNYISSKTSLVFSLKSTLSRHSPVSLISKSKPSLVSVNKLCFSQLIKQNLAISKLDQLCTKTLGTNSNSCFSSFLFQNVFQRGSLFKLHSKCGKPVAAFVRTFSSSTVRLARSGGRPGSNSHKTGVIYIVAVLIFMLGGAYAGVPLYKVFCQASGLGGQAERDQEIAKVETMQAVKDRHITVKFNADVASSMRWNFKPQQSEVTVQPGETALAFYTAKNPTDKGIIGISTYNVLPYEAGQYFNKIQCFCFEEQRLNPNEQVDMPVFFYIDPEFAEDPKLENVDAIYLSYTFFEAKEGLQLPLPGYPQPHDPVVAVS